MTINDARTCPRCHDDTNVKHVCTRGFSMTFRCSECSIEWSARFGSEPRPVFERSPAEAA